MDDMEYRKSLESIASTAYSMGREDGSKDAAERDEKAREAQAQATAARRAAAVKEYWNLIAAGKTEQANRIYTAVFLT